MGPRNALLAALALPATAASAAPEAWQAPTLTITRYDEDWSKLADPTARSSHWTEKFKYIPLGDDAWLTTGIELRARNENNGNPQWGDLPSDSYLWLRALPYADLHLGRVRAFVQPIAAYAIGVNPAPGPIDQTRIDLLQAFADVTLTRGLTLRAGRQMVSLGSERLVGTRYGPNVPLAFDGARGIAAIGPVTISLLALRPVAPGPGNFDDRRSRTRSLWGAYAAAPDIDFYYLGYRNTAATFAARTGPEVRHSLGARYHASRGDWHWNIEAVAQFGRFAGSNIAAWTLATELGRHLPGLPLQPDAVMRLNIISGDSNPADNRLGTFNALFPKGKYFGELSPVGPSNIISANPSLSAALGPTVSASLAGMAYWRYSRADGVYDIPGNLIRAPGTATARFIGKQVEATLAWQATPELELSASLSAFAPGGFIRQTGPAKTITLIGLESNFRF